ncbi:hypothetical protein [Massilia psychrophila]|uniref:hypothetical protein n=1 Tax=Massilia psychrophila TaxID=1603353 RepID=UPI00117E2867|nr:hypothetical protein [Massilia psychrophila]
MLIVTLEASRGVDRAADSPKAQGLHHEALDDVGVARFLKTSPLLAKPFLADEKSRQAHAALGEFVVDIAQPFVLMQRVSLGFVAEKYDQ